MARNGLSARKRARFLDVLAETGNVAEAARLSGLNRQHLYVSRRQDADFAEAWEAALDEAADALYAEARRRAIEGVEQPVFHGGKQVGTRRVYSDRLLVFLMQVHGRDRAGAPEKAGKSAAAGPAEPAKPEDPAIPAEPGKWQTGDGLPIDYDRIEGFDPLDNRPVVLGLRPGLPTRLRPVWEARVRHFLALLDQHRANGQDTDWARPGWPDAPRMVRTPLQPPK